MTDNKSKTAVLVFHYFGEKSYLNRLAQTTVPVWRALEGYDKAILLRHETDVGPFELGEKADKRADVLDVPTAANLAKYLNELGDEGYVVDLYIFSHGLTDKFLVSKGTYGDSQLVSGAYLKQEVRPLKLRMVWGTNCYGASLLDTWRELGAKSASGARYVNFYPTRFKGFVKRWQAGETLSQALQQSGIKLPHTGAHAYILGDALARMKQWGGDVFKSSRVLSKSVHAKAYFTECWCEDEEEWKRGRSGKQFMNYASHMLVAGDRHTTKEDVW